MSDDRDLYGLLGLPVDTDVAHLRYVYEQHVADAVRSNNHQRALQLSQAFDALGTGMRRALYSSTGTTASRFAANQTGRQRRASSRAPDRAAVPDAEKWWYGLLPRFRFVVALIVAPALLVAVGTLEVSRVNRPSSFQQPVFVVTASTHVPVASAVSPASAPPEPAVSLVAPVPTVSPMPGETVLPGYELLAVPANWPTGSDGFMYLACDAPAGIGLTAEAHPGDVLQCPIGSRLVRFSQ